MMRSSAPLVAIGLLLLAVRFGTLAELRAAPQLVATPWLRHTIDNTSQGADGIRFADIDGDGHPDLATPWEEGGEIRIYRYPGPHAVRQPWPRTSVGRVSAPEDAVCADLDQDGRLDLIGCCEGNQRQIQIAFGPAVRDPFSPSAGWRMQPMPDTQRPQAWMYALPGQWDGQGGWDVIAGAKNTGASVTLWRAAAEPRALSSWHRQRLREAGWIMSLIANDMDADGDLDLVLSDRRGPRRGVSWLENPGAAAVRAAAPWPEHAIGGDQQEVMFLDVADLDGDGTHQWVTATLNARLIVFRRKAQDGVAWEGTTIPFPAGYRRGKGVAVGDINGDHRQELVVTTEDGCVAWLSRPPSSQPSAWTWHQVNGQEGYKFDRVELHDLDQDGDLDIVTCEERHNLGVIWYENPRQTPSPADLRP